MNEQCRPRRTAAPEPTLYQRSELASTKLHRTALVLNGVNRLIANAMETQSETELREILEVLDVFVGNAMFHLSEAQDVTEQLVAITSAH